MLGGENNFFRWQRCYDNQLEVIQLIDAMTLNLAFYLGKMSDIWLCLF